MLCDKKRAIKKRINCYSIERRALQVATSDVCALLLKLLFSAKQIKNIFILECVQINSFFRQLLFRMGIVVKTQNILCQSANKKILIEMKRNQFPILQPLQVEKPDDCAPLLANYCSHMEIPTNRIDLSRSSMGW